jgi:hypothetical protein
MVIVLFLMVVVAQIGPIASLATDDLSRPINHPLSRFDDSRNIATVSDSSPPFDNINPLARLDSFITENVGQVINDEILYYARSDDIQVGFGASCVLIDLKSHSQDEGIMIRLTFPGANRTVPMSRGEMDLRSNFFIGNDPANWRTGVRSYHEVVYENLYENIDLIYHFGSDGLKYDILVQPGADLDRVVMSYEGIEGLEFGTNGALIVRTHVGDLQDASPVAWTDDGNKVKCAYKVLDSYSYGFRCDSWDTIRPLFIDPLLYSTYFGGNVGDLAPALFVDDSDNVYMAGLTGSTNLPTKTGVYQAAKAGRSDAFVVKISPDARTLLYVTYIGGSGDDEANGIAVDASGNVYIAGTTQSTNFPVTSGAFQSRFIDIEDIFVAKLNSEGSALFFSTYIGGSYQDRTYAMAIDSSGNSYVTGWSCSLDFPTTTGAFMTEGFNGDCFVTKLNSNGSTLLYSTYLGGTHDDYATTIFVDASGRAYLAGITNSDDFPTTANCYQATIPDYCNAFIAQLNPAGSGLIQSTYLGGSDWDYIKAITIDDSGNIYVAGGTNSTDFPITGKGYQTAKRGYEEAFVSKFNPSGKTLLYSTFIGGSDNESASALAVDADGNAYITGETFSADFPVILGAYQTNYDGANGDAYIAKLDSSGGAVTYATYFGGSDTEFAQAIALDHSGYVCIAGTTYSTDIPITAGVIQTTKGTEGDIFVAKLNVSSVQVTIETVPSGLEVIVAGTNSTAPYTFWCGPDSPVSLDVTSPQGGNSIRHVFTNWSDDGSMTHDILCNETMTLTACFITEHLLTIDTKPQGLNITIDDLNGTAPFSIWLGAGTSHTVTAPSPQQVGQDIWYAFKEWSDGGSRTHAITVDEPKNITVEFSAKYRCTVRTVPSGMNVSVDGMDQLSPFTAWWDADTSHTFFVPSPQFPVVGTCCTFMNWSDGEPQSHAIIVTQSMDLTARFTTEYLVTITTNPSALPVTVDGNDRTAPFSEWWSAGTSFMVSTSSVHEMGLDERCTFINWSDGGSITHMVKVDCFINLTAAFATQYHVVINTEPTVLNVTVDGLNYTAPYSGWWDAGTTVTVSAPSPLLGGRDMRYVFSNWSDNGLQTHMRHIGSSVRIIARFVLQSRIVLVSDPPNLNITVDGVVRMAPYDDWWDTGTMHTISAISPQTVTVGSRFAFIKWSDDGTQAHTIRADGPKSLIVEYVVQYKADIGTNPSDLNVTIDGVDSTTPRSEWWDAGIVHTISVPSPQPTGAGTRFVFVGWSDGGAQAHDVNLSAPGELTATFKSQYLVSIATYPSNLDVRVDGVWSTTPTSFWWADGSAHELYVNITQDDLGFLTWSDGGELLHTHTVTGPTTLTATYTQVAFNVITPADGQTISGTFRISGGASPGAAIQLRVDNGTWLKLSGLTGTRGWSCGWDTTIFANGAHTLEFKAVQGDNESIVVTRHVTVSNAKPMGDEDRTFLLLAILATAIIIISVIILLFFVLRGRQKPSVASEQPVPHEPVPPISDAR